MLEQERQLRDLSGVRTAIDSAIEAERSNMDRRLRRFIEDRIELITASLAKVYTKHNEVVEILRANNLTLSGRGDPDSTGTATPDLAAGLASLNQRVDTLHTGFEALSARVQARLERPEPDLGRLVREQIDQLLPDLDERIDARVGAMEGRQAAPTEAAIGALRAELAALQERLQAAPAAEDLSGRVGRLESDQAGERLDLLARAIDTLAAELHGEGSPLRVGTWKRRELREQLERIGHFDPDAWERLWADDPDTVEAVSRLVIYHMDPRTADAAQTAGFAAWVEQVSRGRLRLIRPPPFERFDERLHHAVAVSPHHDRLDRIVEVQCLGLMDAETVRIKARVTVSG